MAQLGSGAGSTYPTTIDTRQIYHNGVNPAPDSDTRFDAEALNDALTAIVQIETVLGAGVNGAFASLAARLAALLTQVDAGGVTGVSNVVPFSVPMSVTIPGAAHQQDVAALLVQLYDLSTPRQALQAADMTIAPLTYDVTIFFATGQSGVAIVAAPAPYFITSFTTTGSPPTATILGTAHGLSEPYLHFQAWDSQVPAHAVELQTFHVEPGSRNVTLTTGTPMTGTLFLSAGTPRYTQTFAAALTWSIPGATHGLGSPHLFWQCYDASPDPQAMNPEGVSVHPTTRDVVVRWAAPQNGTVALVAAPTVTPVSPPATSPAARLPVAIIRSGGLHGLAPTRLAPAFATEASLASGVDVSQAAVAIDYAALGAAATATAWVIIASATTATLGTFTRVGSSAYFVNVSSPTAPPLPVNAAWLMRVTLSGGAITAVADRRTPRSVAAHGRIDITDALFGADPTGATDASPAIQAAVSLHREMQWPLYAPTAAVGYRVDSVIDMTDMTGQLLCVGDGSLAPTFGRAFIPMAPGSTFLGNTGSGQPVFDCLGSNNTLFRDLNVSTFGQATPSQFGFLFGCSTTSPVNEAPGGANNSLENVAIQMAQATANSCPVYYVAGAGLSHFLNVWTLGVYGFVFTANNALSVVSSYAEVAAPIGIDGIHMQGCNLLGYGPASVLEIETCHNMRLDQLYVATVLGGPAYAGQPYAIRLTDTVDIKIDVECDYFPSVLLTRGAIVGLDLRGTTFPSLTPLAANVPIIAFFNGTSVHASAFHVEPVMGAVANYHYTSDGETPTLTQIVSSTFTFTRLVSNNVAFFNMTSAAPKPFVNLHFDGNADGGTYSLNIGGALAGPGTMRYWENGVLVGTG